MVRLGDHLNEKLEEGDEVRWGDKEQYLEVVSVDPFEDRYSSGTVVAEGPRGGEYRIITTTNAPATKYVYRVYAGGADQYYTSYSEMEVKGKQIPLRAWRNR